ncbi:hypothetical protein NEMBOFW57_010661 [Staphylotrichum longicolle]|uniref:DUF6594 domain-containing protein n=1 Tax=Staphylotrichum longicolle TaxID=669026 RepID=A0AAD4EN54_9PEZI|nr:hypothetical protein NEMBOFW57_010661 [Staphylotrichum longicolle]
MDVENYESFVFRKFDRLSARNLLHLEARLAYLEHKLDQSDEEAALPSADNETQEALLRQNQIAVLEAPKKRALDVAYNQSYDGIKDELGHIKRRRPLLAGLADKDLLSQFLQDHWMFKRHLKTTKVTDDTEHIKENHVAWVAAGVSTIIAAILLLGAIVTLRLLTEENTRLGLIALFTVLFAASVGILTNARRAEIFAATAANAAVLVVFMSSDPGNCTCKLGG